MFKAKQLFTLLSVATFAAVSTLVLLQAIRTEAQAQVEFAIYKGSVWSSASPGQKKASTLYLRPANPVTGSTQATEDDVACTGSQQGQRVILLCDGIRFDGLIDGRFYKGQWMPTSTSQEGGGFEYKFVKNFTKQP